MKWVLVVSWALTVSATGAWADRYSDCNQQNDVDRQIRGCTRIIERGTRESNHNRIAAYFNRGSAYMAKAEHDRAIADYTELIALNPTNPSTYNSRGKAYFAKGDYDRSLLRCRRGCAAFSQAPKVNRSQFCGRIRMTFAAWMKSVRRYQLPRLEMRPRIDLPPVLYWRGTSRSQAPKSRPRSKASPVPMAATIAVEIIGPIPGTLISRLQFASQ